MSGPKMGLGRVDREGETASRFSHSLPGPLSPFPELPYRDIGTRLSCWGFSKPHRRWQSQFLISLPSFKLGPLMGHSFDSQHALYSACSRAAQPLYGLQLLSRYALIVHTSSGMVGG